MAVLFIVQMISLMIIFWLWWMVRQMRESLSVSNERCSTALYQLKIAQDYIGGSRANMKLIQERIGFYDQGISLLKSDYPDLAGLYFSKGQRAKLCRQRARKNAEAKAEVKTSKA